MSKQTLIIGSGSREHALAWKLSQSPQISTVYVAPANGGIEKHGGKVRVADLDVTNFAAVTAWCKQNAIDLVVVGPEDPLSKGMSDSLNASGVPCFGPSQKAARIESDKAFAKDFMQRHGVPTARFQNFTKAEKAKEFVRQTGALVVKASGLAAGKGVVVAKNVDEAFQAIDEIMVKKVFGDAGDQVVVEEFLEGEEVSIFALSDGTHFQMMMPAQDHKRAYVNDQGPNTGGMGAFCPYPFLEQGHLKTIERDIFERVIGGMKSEGYPFVGLLYAGLILTKDGPKVIEFNCRFGDPETQSVLPMLQSDLYDALQACMTKTIASTRLQWKDKFAVGVVVASGGYPGTVVKNIPIEGLDELDKSGLLVFHGGTIVRDGKFYTNGGRILTVVAVEDSLEQAVSRAISGTASLKIEKSFIRNDIALKSIRRLNTRLDYKASGVDIDAGNRLVEHIKKFAKRTNRSGVMDQIGGFGALFDLKQSGLRDPILVSGTDGVGTKLKIAIDTGKLDTVGIDLVAMCVNDILVQGAEPLFFLDYFACSHLDVEAAASVIKGISDGCVMANSALIGGETAEMPGMYMDGDFDLAGFAVGAVERELILPRKESIVAGDVVIGLSSSGVHSNGFSLVRKILDTQSIGYEQTAPFDGRTFGEVLLTPTKIYVKSTLPLIKQNLVKALAHITGGGLTENIPRVLEKHLAVELDANQWPIPPIFTWLKSAGSVSDQNMLKTFNCGLGMTLMVNAVDVATVLDILKSNGETGYIIGKVIPKQTEQVIVHNFSQSILREQNAIFKSNMGVVAKKRVAVLISGSGTNLKAIIDHVTSNYHKTAIDLALVISDKKSADGLKFAQEAAIPCKVLIKKKEQSREEYDQLLHDTLEAANIELVCLAGFMRILSEQFVTKWVSRMINIHPSLLPSFKGVDAYGQALAAGVKITGCTAHFVTTEMDEGPVIMQDIVRILPGETHDSLVTRGKAIEHGVYPRALELVASNQVAMIDGKLVYNN